MKHYTRTLSLFLFISFAFSQTQLGSDIDGEAQGDWSGWSVSMNSAGDRVAIGATNNDGTASNAGHVRIYEYSNSSWTQLGSDIDGEAASDFSGWLMMAQPVTQVMYGFMSTVTAVGHSSDLILMVKLRMTIPATQFL